MEQQSFTKLGALIDQVFTVTSVGKVSYKMWSPTENKMLVSDTWEKGYQKKYRVETDKGILELSSSQLSQLLEGVVKDGVADINGRSFQVKSNGKTGLEVRYYLNPVTSQPRPQSIQDPEVKAKLEAARPEQPPVENYNTLDDEPIDLSSIPF